MYFRYQYVRLRDVGENLNIGSVAVGEYFGLIGRRQQKDCDGGQLGITGAVFAQFDLNADSYDLINADYNVGLPFSYRRGPLSFRLRPYHESTHIGDEFLLNHPKFNRLTSAMKKWRPFSHMRFSYVPIWFRNSGSTVAARGCLIASPGFTERGANGGIEIRGTDSRRAFLTKVMQKKMEAEKEEQVTGLPFIALDVKQFEQHRWNLETSVIAGMEYYRASTRRRLRLYVTYYHGFNPRGQFFISQKIESFGAGLSLAF